MDVYDWVRAQRVQTSYCSVHLSTDSYGYLSYPVSSIDDRTHIESASISFIAWNYYRNTLRIKIMDRELHELHPKIVMDCIYQEAEARRIIVDTNQQYSTYTVDFRGDALEQLRDVVAGDDEYLVIAFYIDITDILPCDIYARYSDSTGDHH